MQTNLRADQRRDATSWALMAKPSARRAEEHGPPTAVRAVRFFVLAGLVGALLLAAGSIVASRRAASDEAIQNARRETRLVARTAITPALDDGVLTGDAASLARLDREVRSRVLDQSLVRVKVWRADGRILYSDRAELIGSTYTLGGDEQAALRSGHDAADISDLSQPENRFDRAFHKLLEVYLPVRTPSGQALLFETYFRYNAVTSGGDRIWRQFAPIMLGSLLALELLQIPLARSLVRRLRAGQQREEQLLRRAVDASAIERRRIASDLHDGVVQDLAGVSYALASVQDAEGDTADVVREAAAGTRRSIRALRSLLVEIYPPSLRDTGLRAALSDLTAPLAAHGVETTIDLPDDLEFPPDIEALLFRATQEALRNVVGHADARHVAIRLHRPDHTAVLDVEDDGIGFDPGRLVERRGQGHVGLRVLSDLTADAGGALGIDSRPGGGTRLHVEVPLR